MAIHVQRRAFSSFGAAALAVGVALSGGCSVLFHADANQCSTTTDCTARGPAFAGFQCSQGTCIAAARDATSPCMTNADCIASGTGFTCKLGTCVAPLDGGAEAIAEAGGDAAAETGAEAGIGCRTTADCASLAQMYPSHQEVACDVSTNTCVHLTSDECPYLIPADYASPGPGGTLPPPPIFIGAFAKFPSAPFTHPSYLNYQLALDEFKVNGPGIPAGPSTSSDGLVLGYRTPVAVACDVEGNVDNAMMHLISDVHVESIVSSLPSAALNHVFTTYASAQQSSVLVVNAFGADSTLTALSTNNLLWHMLGQPSDDAAAYAGFLPLVESYLRTKASWGGRLGTIAPMKVAVVTANATVLNNLAAAVLPVLTWNQGFDGGVGQAVSSNPDFLQVGISDSTLNGTSLTDPNLIKSINNAVTQLLNFKPHVIVSLASEEFSKVLENVEIGWSGGVPPFYLLSPYNEGSLLLQNAVPNLPYTNTRFAGIGVASTTDQAVLDAYQKRFLTAYPTRQDALGAENYYDAMYFAIYSLVAAGRQKVTGTDLGAGMKHLISLSSTPYRVGPADMGNIFTVLGLRQSIDLIGALGPPDFDTATGARIGQGDVYCIGYDPSADSGTKYPYAYDVLRLSSSGGGLAPDAGSAFQGTFSCYPGIQ